MTVSVRMDPLLQKELELAAKRRGITKSQFITDAVRLALGHKDAHALMLEMKAKYPQPAGRSSAERLPSNPEDWNGHLTSKLREKHERESAEYQAWQARRGSKRRAA